MTDKGLKTGRPQPDDSGFRLVLVCLAAALATFVIAISHFSARGTVDESMALSFGASYAWVGSQSFLLNVPGLLLGLAIAKYLPRIGTLLGSMLMFAVPILFFCDVTTFRWIGERFLSGTMHTIATSLAPALMHHVTRSSLIDAGLAAVVAMIAICCTWNVAGWASRRWANSRDPVRPFSSAMVLLITAFVMATPAAWNRTRTLSDMSRNSTRHPFCAFHLVGYRGVGVRVPQGEKAILARLRGLQVAPQVQATDRRHDALALDRASLPGSVNARQLQDVIIIVIESMRPELVSPEIMPNLHAFSQRSIRCNRHFSAGNSTTYGIFGLVNGMEAVWFDRPIWKSPMLNRFFHQACYELGFFGGEDDWPEFGMDGFIGGAQFDYFMIEYPKPLETDYRAVQRAQDFINEGKRLAKENPENHRPRLGIAYVLATHCRYISEEQDQIFQPAAPENFLIPYTEATKPQIYNRYKNSARSVDRMIAPLLRDDCIVVVTGDHGESFMEDGSAIHGLRLSKVQNTTPMIIHYPGVEPRVIEQRTMHADVLPTLMSILELRVNEPELLGGCDLTTVDDETLRERIFTTSNFIDQTLGLIGPWTDDPEQPFAYRFLCQIGDWQVSYLNPIDDQGYEWAKPHRPGDPDGMQLVRDWIARHVGDEMLNEDLTEAELFTKFFKSDDRETRMSVLKIAEDIASPEPYLYDLITEAASDANPDVRELAKDIIIRTARSAGRD